MQHAVFHGDNKISISRCSVPVAEKGEVRVKVERCALCTSDNPLWQEGARHTPGQEIYGIVDQAGHYRDGERVCVYCPAFCGSCESCKAGHTQSCQHSSVFIGLNRDGGFAEVVIVPDHCLLPVPDSIDDRLAPMLSSTVATAAHAVRAATKIQSAEADRRWLINGAGPLGLSVLIALQDAGYQNIAVSDPQPTRLAFAKAQGARVAEIDSSIDERQFGLIFHCGDTHALKAVSNERIAAGGAIVVIGNQAPAWSVPHGILAGRQDFYFMRSFYFPITEHVENINLLLRQKSAYQTIANDELSVEISLNELAGVYPRFFAGEMLKPQIVFS